MKVIINETNEVTELSAIDISTGVDWTADLTSDDDNFVYDYEESCYRTTQASFDFWSEYIGYMMNDAEEEETLKQIYDIGEVNEIIAEETEIINDYDRRHDCYQKAFERIRAELKPF